MVKDGLPEEVALRRKIKETKEKGEYAQNFLKDELTLFSNEKAKL